MISSPLITFETSEAAFIHCDFTDAELISETSSASFLLTELPSYFACQVAGHCGAGQKLVVTEVATTTPPPGLSGYLAEIDAKKITDSPIDSEGISNYKSNLATLFHVHEHTVNVSVSYEISGSISLSANEDMTEQDLVANMTHSLSSSLGVDISSVRLELDMIMDSSNSF